MNDPFRDLLASPEGDERQVYNRPSILYSQVSVTTDTKSITLIPVLFCLKHLLLF